jgi:3-oxoacyl-[acyl-carrier-protein] synthase I
VTAVRWTPAAITGLGLVTAVGHGAAETAAAVRAGLANLHEHPTFFPITKDPGWVDDEPLLCGAVPGLDPFLPGPKRLVELAAMALNDLVKSAGLARRDFANMALCVALPALDEVVRSWGLSDLFVPDLLAKASLAAFPAVRVLHAGPTGMLELVKIAASLFEEGTVERCLLLGVDTYLDDDRLSLLDGRYRIRSARAVDGFLPGEAAAALVLEPRSVAEARGAPVLATMSVLGVGDEPRAASGDRQSSGAGLCEALSALFAAGGEDPAWVLCDLNGESYKSYEGGLALTRLEQLASVQRLTHPADCHGDIGAATAGCLIGCAVMGLQRGYALAADATLFCGSDGGLRMAARVTR